MSRPIDNPPNPFESRHVEWLGEAPAAEVRVYEERTGEILARNDSPDLPFRWSVNPYRGCFHACAYCYARRTHEYLGFGAGSDFESRIVVKTNAPERLRAAFDRRRWQGELIALSGNADCYQPLEASYELTRGLLEVCLEYRNPIEIVTKGALVRRDAELLAELSRCSWARVWISLAFASGETARRLEPQAPSPKKRLEALAVLSAAGVPTGVIAAPWIPGLNDSDIPAILESAREAGARHASFSMLRLPGSVESVFLQRLKQAFPDRAEKVVSKLRVERGGRLNESRLGERGIGQSPLWQSAQQLFRVTADRLGYEPAGAPPRPSTFRRPGPRQATLF